MDALDDDQMSAILDAEREMRLSPETQAKFRACATDDQWMDVVAEEQSKLAVELAFSMHLDPRVVLVAMRKGAWIRPHLRHKSIHVQFNRAKESLIPQGDPFVPLTLFDEAQGCEVEYPSVLQEQKNPAPRFSIAISGSLT